jgi:hypothetical protein
MAKREGTGAQLLAAPHDFLHGLLGGLFGPLLALVGAVGLVYLLTRQLPALKEVTRNDGTRHKTIALTSPLEARATWARYGGELRGAMLELRARARPNSEG